jgi:hypothetical protein
VTKNPISSTLELADEEREHSNIHHRKRGSIENISRLFQSRSTKVSSRPLPLALALPSKVRSEFSESVEFLSIHADNGHVVFVKEGNLKGA